MKAFPLPGDKHRKQNAKQYSTLFGEIASNSAFLLAISSKGIAFAIFGDFVEIGGISSGKIVASSVGLVSSAPLTLLVKIDFTNSVPQFRTNGKVKNKINANANVNKQ